VDRRGNVWAPLIAAAVIATLGGLVASRAWHTAATFHPRLNVPRPPLGAVAPALGPEGAPLARRVVIVIIDGLRFDASFGTPWLDGLRRRGVEAIGRAPYPSWSRPNQAAVVLGVPPIASGIRSNDYGFPVALDSLMDRAAARGLSSAYVADVSFGMARMFHADFEAMHYVPWPGGLDKALRLVLRHDYALVVAIPGAVDKAGHQHGADSREYREAIAEVDQLLADALAELDLSRDALIVTSDHGHTDEGGHGGVEREVLEVPVILAGAGIRAGAAVGDVELVDLAPTAAALLGVAPPGHGVGSTITAALELPAERRAAIEAADRQRVERNLATLANSAAAAAERAAAIRTPRLIGIAMALLLVAFALVALIRIGAVQIDRRGLLIALPAFPLTFYLLVDLLGGRFSLSAVPDTPDALDRIFNLAMIATAVQVVASWAALHGRQVLRERLAAAAGLTLCTLLVSWLPAGVMWALYDPDSQPVLASSTALVLAPATWVAVSFVAIASAVTLGLELVIFFARGFDPRVRLRRLKRATARVEREILEKRKPPRQE
jgi:hypothetical protein